MDNSNQIFSLPQPQMPAQPEYYGSEHSPESHLRDYVHILMKRKWWVLAFMAVVVGMAIYMNMKAIPLYMATATLRMTIENEGGSLVGGQSPYPWMRDDDKEIETQSQIMRSRSLAKRVINILNLREHPEFRVAVDPKAPIQKSPEEMESNLIDNFLGKLKTELVKRTDLIHITFISADKDLAQNVANAMAGEYMQFQIDCKNQSFFHIKKWLETQLVQLGNKVEGSQRKLYDYGNEGEILSTEDKDNVVVQKYVELSGLITKASSERMTREAQYRELKAKGDGGSAITNNPQIASLRQQIAMQSAKVASMQGIFLPDHPKFKAEKDQLGGLQTQLKGQMQSARAAVESDYEAARQAENLLLEAAEKQKKEVANLQKKLVQYKILKRDVETNEELYKGLLSRMKEAAVASTMVPSNVAVIDPAERPLSPFKPDKHRNLMMAILIGLVGGTFLAFAVEYFDDSIKSAEEAERYCQLPTLGLIPLQRRGRKDLVSPGEDKKSMIIHNDPKSTIADSIFVVRTSVLLSVPGGPPAAIMIASPNPLEGKTTMATNLSISLAMSGRKVVLIDGDLRRPSIHKIFNQLPQPGLSDLLTGTATYEEVLRPTEIPNLYLIPAGPLPPNPATLLGSMAFKDIMAFLRDEFQHVIIDTPPTLSMPDSRVLSSMVDAVILVIRHNYTPRETARMARQALTQVNAQLIGLVLNQVAFDKTGYYSYYYKKYHYHYYGRG
jgi:succinoglycan biosynthesis transport protein ExoP